MCAKSSPQSFKGSHGASRLQIMSVYFGHLTVPHPFIFLTNMSDGSCMSLGFFFLLEPRQIANQSSATFNQKLVMQTLEHSFHKSFPSPIHYFQSFAFLQSVARKNSTTRIARVKLTSFSISFASIWLPFCKASVLLLNQHVHPRS